MKTKISPLKISLVTDIHNGPDHLTKKGTSAIQLVREFCEFSRTWQADIVVDMGDRLSDIDVRTDKMHLLQIAEEFKQIAIPRGHILGNHDLENLSSKDNAELLGVEMASRKIMLNGYNLIFWQANTKNFWPDGLNLNSKDLDWLQNTLSAAVGPCIIFTHVPLDSGSMAGNYYFDKAPRFATYPEAMQAVRIIEKSSKVVLCIAGHVHWNNFNQIGGIPYLSLHSLTESSTTHPEPCGAWASLEISDKIEWIVYGQNPVHLTIPLPDPDMNRKRLPPLQPGFTAGSEKQKTRMVQTAKAVLFDLDGVFYEGERALPGGREVIEFLKRTGRSYMAVTNNSLYLPEEFSQKLKKMGVDIPAEMILTASQVVADQLQKGTKTPTVHILGSKALREILLSSGAIESDKPEYVVVGWHNNFSAKTLKKAVSLLLNGSKLIGSNKDSLIPALNGPEPENGALIAFLEQASGQKAHIFGKPNPEIYKMALNKLNIKPADAIMVGDTLETDILGASYYGIKTIYINPLGVCPSSYIKPNIIIPGLKHFIDVMSASVGNSD